MSLRALAEAASEAWREAISKKIIKPQRHGEHRGEVSKKEKVSLGTTDVIASPPGPP